MYAFVLGTTIGFVVYYLLPRYRKHEAKRVHLTPPAFHFLIDLLAGLAIVMIVIGAIDLFAATPRLPSENFYFVRRLVEEDHLTFLAIGLLLGTLLAIWLQPSIETVEPQEGMWLQQTLELRLLKRRRLGWAVLFLALIGFFQADLRRLINSVTQVSTPGGFALTLSARAGAAPDSVQHQSQTLPQAAKDNSDTYLQTLAYFRTAVLKRDEDYMVAVHGETWRKHAIFGNAANRDFYAVLAEHYVQPAATCLFEMRQADRRRLPLLHLSLPLTRFFGSAAADATATGDRSAFQTSLNEALAATKSELGRWKRWHDHEACQKFLKSVPLPLPDWGKDPLALPYVNLIASLLHGMRGEAFDSSLPLASWLTAAERHVAMHGEDSIPLWMRLRVVSHLAAALFDGRHYRQLYHLFRSYEPRMARILAMHLRPGSLAASLTTCGRHSGQHGRQWGLPKIWQRFTYLYLNHANNVAMYALDYAETTVEALERHQLLKTAADHIKCFDPDIMSWDAGQNLRAAFLDTYAMTLLRARRERPSAGGPDAEIRREDIRKARAALIEAIGVMDDMRKQLQATSLVGSSGAEDSNPYIDVDEIGASRQLFQRHLRIATERFMQLQ